MASTTAFPRRSHTRLENTPSIQQAGARAQFSRFGLSPEAIRQSVWLDANRSLAETSRASAGIISGQRNDVARHKLADRYFLCISPRSTVAVTLIIAFSFAAAVSARVSDKAQS